MNDDPESGPDIRSVEPGDRLILENRGKQFGGTVWRSPTTGDLLAGDTFLTHNGEWIPTTARIVELTRRCRDT